MTAPAAIEDLPVLLDLGEQFRREFAPTLRQNPDRLEQTMRWLLAGPDTLLRVALHRDTVVGLIGCCVVEHPLSGDRVASELFWYLIPEARHGGGVQLLYDAESWAESVGADLIHVAALATNPGIGELYRRAGYVPRDTTFEKGLGG